MLGIVGLMLPLIYKNMCKLLSVVLMVAGLSAPALAKAGPATEAALRLALVTAHSGETLELSFVLDGITQPTSAADCKASFRIVIKEPTGLISSVIDEVTLGPGDFHKFEFPFSMFVSDGTGLAIVELARIRQTGQCRLRSFSRLVAEGGETRAITVIVNNEIQDVGPDSAVKNSPRPFQKFLVSGSSDEKLEIAFHGIDGLARFTIEARDATGESSYETIEVVELAAGETQIVEFSFDEFGSDGASHVLITITNDNPLGISTVLSAARWVAVPGGETRSINVDLSEFTLPGLNLNPVPEL